MNASAFQTANLAPMSVEEMEMVDGGGIFLVIGIVIVACVVISMCNPPAANAPTTNPPPHP